jgi:energy-coupling factor transporter transmembrane protein EcfT
VKKNYIDLSNYILKIHSYLRDLSTIGLYKDQEGFIQRTHILIKIIFYIGSIIIIFLSTKLVSYITLLVAVMLIYLFSKVPSHSFLIKILFILAPLFILLSTPYLLLGREIYAFNISIDIDRVIIVAKFMLRTLYLITNTVLLLSTVSITEIHDILSKFHYTNKLSFLVLMIYRDLHRYLRKIIDRLIALKLRVYSSSIREVWSKQISLLSRSLVRDLETAYLVNLAILARERSLAINYFSESSVKHYYYSINSNSSISLRKSIFHISHKLCVNDYILMILMLLLWTSILFIERLSYA